MGGSPTLLPERYRSGNPGDLLPITTPQWLVQGSEDDQIPPQLPGAGRSADIAWANG